MAAVFMGLILLCAVAIVWPQFRALRVELARARELKKREQELWRSGGIAQRTESVRVEKLVSRRSHTPKVAGSSPAPATNSKKGGAA